MISVRCPACGKVIGFEESDGGSLVACPHCREPFFVPAVARPVAAPPPPGSSAPAPTEPPIAPPLPQAPALPDDIRLADDPDLDPIPEALDEVLPAENEEPPPDYDVVEEPEAPPDPDPILNLELDPPEPPPAGTPAVVQPTDLAPSLPAAASLSGALPPEKKEPEGPADVLEEVTDEEEHERFYDEPEEKDEKDEEEDEEEVPRPRRGSKKQGPKYRTPYHAQPPRPGGLTRNRIVGGVGAGMGGLILLGTLTHHLTASQSAWHYGVCCGDLFAAALFGVGLYYLIKG